MRSVLSLIKIKFALHVPKIASHALTLLHALAASLVFILHLFNASPAPLTANLVTSLQLVTYVKQVIFTKAA